MAKYELRVLLRFGMSLTVRIYVQLQYFTISLYKQKGFALYVIILQIWKGHAVRTLFSHVSPDLL